ncbi:MAG: hypothetical protein SPL02_03035 [Bacilli bacterium]|nr:hypothetical protein [Bacilli bacterium]MDY6430872.1 hypothetical protein [Bacilli bacterium]
MKKVARTLITLSFVGALLSCSSTSSKDDPADYPYDNSFPYFQKNGDIYNTNIESQDYYSYAREANLDTIISKICSGESIFLYLYGEFCQHCIEFKPILFSFLKEYQYEMYAHSATLSSLNPLIAAFPSYAETFEYLVTPSVYFLQDENKAFKVNIDDARVSSKAFKNAISAQSNLLNMYSIRTMTGFQNILNKFDSLIYFDNGENEHTYHLFLKVKETKRKIIRVETSFLSEQEKSYLLENYPNEFYVSKNATLTSVSYDQIDSYFS